jgi:hypothetical protein
MKICAASLFFGDENCPYSICEDSAHRCVDHDYCYSKECGKFKENNIGLETQYKCR